MKLELPIDSLTYQKMVKKAGKDPQSIQRLGLRILHNALGVSDNLEDRQFVGQTISGKDVVKSGNFIAFGGIYYKVHILGSDKADPQSTYKVVSSDGNIINLQATK